MDKWKAISDSIQASPKYIKVLQSEPHLAEKAAEAFAIPAESTLGAVISNCGGIVVENRLRIYGAGAVDIRERNEMYRAGVTVVAEDIFGGLFFIAEDGLIQYFAPDTLAPEETDLSYSEFLFWAVTGDTDSFYESFSYNGWSADADTLSDSSGISFYPPPWTAEGKDAEKCSRCVIPMRELIGMELDIRSQLEKVQN